MNDSIDILLQKFKDADYSDVHYDDAEHALVFAYQGKPCRFEISDNITMTEVLADEMVNIATWRLRPLQGEVGLEDSTHGNMDR